VVAEQLSRSRGIAPGDGHVAKSGSFQRRHHGSSELFVRSSGRRHDQNLVGAAESLQDLCCSLVTSSSTTWGLRFQSEQTENGGQQQEHQQHATIS
jgi:hypothetical protein